MQIVLKSPTISHWCQISKSGGTYIHASAQTYRVTFHLAYKVLHVNIVMRKTLASCIDVSSYGVSDFKPCMEAYTFRNQIGVG